MVVVVVVAVVVVVVMAVVVVVLWLWLVPYPHCAHHHNCTHTPSNTHGTHMSMHTRTHAHVHATSQTRKRAPTQPHTHTHYIPAHRSTPNLGASAGNCNFSTFLGTSAAAPMVAGRLHYSQSPHTPRTPAQTYTHTHVLDNSAAPTLCVRTHHCSASHTHTHTHKREFSLLSCVHADTQAPYTQCNTDTPHTAHEPHTHAPHPHKHPTRTQPPPPPHTAPHKHRTRTHTTRTHTHTHVRSGVVGLMLEAQPNLGWRDVIAILVCPYCVVVILCGGVAVVIACQ